jgi:hypothetical protein
MSVVISFIQPDLIFMISFSLFLWTGLELCIYILYSSAMRYKLIIPNRAQQLFKRILSDSRGISEEYCATLQIR